MSDEQANNGDYLIGILRKIRDTANCSQTTKELASFLLEGPESSDDDVPSRRISLLVICEEIFKYHPAALVEMNMQVFEFLKETNGK